MNWYYSGQSHQPCCGQPEAQMSQVPFQFPNQYQFGFPGQFPGQQVPTQQRPTYSEDLLKQNIGKRITAYLSFDATSDWRNRIVNGILEAVGRDYFVMRDEKTGKDTIFMTINLDFITLDEPITDVPTQPGPNVQRP